ncbi:MAG TPA: hypothetical protein PKV71_04205, partial [Calditrichia bacterium]|nr:hypothetical protein [Calditrichia bacterium]
ARSEKREARSEKREARSEKREARSEKREAISDQQSAWNFELCPTQRRSKKQPQQKEIFIHHRYRIY